MAKKILKGERVRLRFLKERDIPLINKWNTDSRTMKWTENGDPPVSIRTMSRQTAKDLRGILKSKFKVDKFFIVEIVESVRWKPIGWCSLSDISKVNRKAIFHISMDPDYRREDYGTESTKILLNYAFENLGLNRVGSYVIAYNEPSIKLHEKVRFVRECESKGEIYRNRKFWNAISFRIMKSEWKILKKNWNICKGSII